MPESAGEAEARAAHILGHAGLYSETPPQKPKAELLFVSGKEQSEDSVCLISAGDTEGQAVALFYGKCCHRHRGLCPLSGAPGTGRQERTRMVCRRQIP